jgi:hypothetical protein
MSDPQERKAPLPARKPGRSGEHRVRASKASPDVFNLLAHLDRLLEQAVQRARAQHAEGDGDAAFRGIYISEHEVDRIIDLGPGGNAVGTNPLPEVALEHFQTLEPLEAASSYWQLTPFDHGVLLLALAPELDLRYERIYAYLQDDVTRRRPTVDLALQLLCDSPRERIIERRRFAPDAGLLRSGLLRLVADQNQLEPPLLAHYLRLDERAVRALIGDDRLDPRLRAYCERDRFSTKASQLGAEGDIARRLPHYVATARGASRPVRILFTGPATIAKRSAGEALAATENAPLLHADLALHESWRSDPGDVALSLLREAALSGSVLMVSGLRPTSPDDAAVRVLVRALSAYAGILLLASDGALPGASPEEFLGVPFSLPERDGRQALWRRAVSDAGFAPDEAALAALTNNFSLAPEQIRAAVEAARQRLEWRVTAVGTLRPGDVEAELLVAARAQTGAELATLTVRKSASYRWSDLVLPADSIQHLREICARVANSHRVAKGVQSPHFARATGVAVLFAGPSGTGKTMAAEVIANDLGLDLFRIDLSSVTSKYIGETEKNLERIFQAALRSNSVLLFDEADALFGKRSEVHDAHDRYANIEISYLLQRMEQYDGITILTTNQRSNLDEAFVRRLAFTIHFPFPEERERQSLWKKVWPVDTAIAPGVDFAVLARQFRLSGGNIRNIALSAALRAAGDERAVGLDDILHATRREYEKVGRLLSPAELEGAVA